ncbi:MAG: NAD(P)H-dependent oxidoreductase [Candidatus Peribacteraceae bacterium]|nr:NAD(P)H-dependent oxidoreductase [Candidatus Peribacteraceae bacterium]MDD5074949.1 NAD(P)H-dependent oxidoreductase [Candidatus Peribacteraceae bacterium]
MKILVLLAGTNDPSNANVLADAFIEGIRLNPASEVTKLFVRDLGLEHFSLKHYAPDAPEEEDFRRLKEAFRNLNGLVIASPVWNFSVPAHLKNLIDRIGAFGLGENHTRAALTGLPFFLIFTGGAPAPAWTALLKKTTSSVAEAFKYFGAAHCGTHFEPRCTKGRGVFGLVVHERPGSLKKVRSEGEKFSRLVSEYARTGKLPLKRSLANLANRIIRSFAERFF